VIKFVGSFSSYDHIVKKMLAHFPQHYVGRRVMWSAIWSDAVVKVKGQRGSATLLQFDPPAIV